MMLSRRRFLSCLASAPFALNFPMAATAADTSDWRVRVLMRERVLRLSRPDSKERLNFCYWRPSTGWDARGYMAACHLLRDVKFSQQRQIDPHLLDVLFIMQVWLQAYGQPSDIQILSGYRTPEHNGRLEGAAKNSLHMQGRAADIHIPGMSTQVLANMGKMIAVGGVGLYPSRGFIHVDTGSLRSWIG
ncbi:TPA: YcbK family protein [Pseudomonas aeruginosa]